MIKSYWLSTKKFSGGFAIEDGIVIGSKYGQSHTMPILYRFVGQPVQNLFNWLENNFQDYKIKELE